VVGVGDPRYFRVGEFAVFAIHYRPELTSFSHFLVRCCVKRLHLIPTGLSFFHFFFGL